MPDAESLLAGPQTWSESGAENGMELYELRHVVNLALDVIAGDPSFLEAEICASWCDQHVAELSHDTAHPRKRRTILARRNGLRFQHPPGHGRRRRPQSRLRLRP